MSSRWILRSRGNVDARLTESRSEPLLVMPTESLTNREWLPGELLSGSEHRRPSWFLDMKYQTCYSHINEVWVGLLISQTVQDKGNGISNCMATFAKCVCQPLSPLECVVEGQAAASFHRQALVNYSTRPATTTLASIMGCHITWHFASIVARHNCFELSVGRLRHRFSSITNLSVNDYKLVHTWSTTQRGLTGSFR